MINSISPLSTTLSSSTNDKNNVVEIMVDRVAWKTKPQKPDFPAIHNRLANGRERLTIAEVKDVLLNGGIITPAAYRGGGPAGDTWESQQLYGLDFDHNITIEQFFDRCSTWQIFPAFVYKTFNHTDDHHRFRAIFVSDRPTYDMRIRNLTQYTLREMFTERNQAGIVYEPDPACDDPARRFLGTNQGLISESLDSRINVIDLLNKLLDAKRAYDKNNYARFLERFAKKTKLKLCQHGIGVRLDINRIAHYSSDESMANPIYTITRTIDSSPIALPVSHSIAIFENSIYQMMWNIVPQKSTSSNNHHSLLSHTPNHTGGILKEGDKPRLYPEDKQILLENCRLANDFFTGSRQLRHIERRRLLTNLRHRRGGVKWYNEGLNSRSDYEQPESILKQAIRFNYLPEDCKRCRYETECDHKTNLLQQLPVRQREARRITKRPQQESLQKTYLKLQDAIVSAIRSNDRKIHVIKADVGTGKTQILLRSLPKEFAVAFPTHKLKQEAFERYTAITDQRIFLWPERPPLPDKYERILQHCFDIRRGGTLKLFEDALKEPEVCKDPEWLFDIQRYLDKVKAVKSQERTVLTHEKAFQLYRPRVLIFDEDFLNSFIRMTDHSIKDIEMMLDFLRTVKGKKYRQIEHHLEYVVNAPSNEVQPIDFCNYPQQSLHNVIMAMPKSYASPVEALFSGKAFIKASSDRAARESIHCIEMQTLRNDATYIVLSATANVDLYHHVFGDRLEFIDLTGTETQGRCIVHNSRGFSKTSIAKDIKGFVRQVKAAHERYGFDHVITHQAFVKALEKVEIPVAGHFGALEGLDSLGGANIGIFGTPHLPRFCYQLYADLSSIDVKKGAFDYKMRPVKRNGFEFQFPLCSERSELQELQLALIEAQLVQAVGRARLVRNNCRVHVFASLPVPGCELANEM